MKDIPCGYMNEELDSRYTEGRDYSIGSGNQKGHATSDDFSTPNADKVKKDGLIERKPL